MSSVREWFGEGASRTLAVTVGCAVVLLSAYVASKLADDAITEDPTGYRLLTLCGLAATLALAVGAWREAGRVAAVAAIAAAAAFALAASAAVEYWHSATWGAPRGQSFQPSPLLPFFSVVAVVGTLCAAILAVQWWRSRW